MTTKTTTPAQLYNQGNIKGTVDGAFNYVVGPLNVNHGFSIDGSGGQSDYVNVAGYDATASQNYSGVDLFVLPTPGWKPRLTYELANGDEDRTERFAEGGLQVLMATGAAPDVRLPLGQPRRDACR